MLHHSARAEVDQYRLVAGLDHIDVGRVAVKVKVIAYFLDRV